MRSRKIKEPAISGTRQAPRRQPPEIHLFHDKEINIMACVTKRRDRYVVDCYDQFGRRRRKTMPVGTRRRRDEENSVFST